MAAPAAPSSILEAYADLKPLLASYGPARLQEWRQANAERFAAAGLPGAKDEEFRYLSLRALGEIKFGPAYGATIDPSDLDGRLLAGLACPTITLVNGEYAPELSNVSGLPDGVEFVSLADALNDPLSSSSEILGTAATFEGKLGSTNDDRFVALSSALAGEGAYLRVGAGADAGTVHVRSLVRADHGSFVTCPRILILLEEGASANIVESHIGLGGAPCFCNAVTEARVGERARLHHVLVQDASPNATQMCTVFVTQGGHSVYDSCQIAAGGSVARHEVNVIHEGEETETWLNGVYLGDGDQVRANHTRIDHSKPNCRSFEVFKGILGGRALGVFNGKIFVYEDAQKTDAKQTNQALLLSPTASINTKPQLEIFADDVKCTHGATVGQLRDDSLFYLRARGIPEAEARRLLIYAFAAEALEKIQIDEVRNELESSLFHRFTSEK